MRIMRSSAQNAAFSPRCSGRCSMETTVPQIYIFLITLYGGMIAGFAYDVYRGIRRSFKTGKWVTALLDTMFIITLGAIVVAVMYAANAGELRLYTFVGFVLGFALYMAGISPFLSFLARKLRKWLSINKENKK